MSLTAVSLIKKNECLKISQFLNNRKLSVIVNNISSDLINVKSGVPQRKYLIKMTLLLFKKTWTAYYHGITIIHGR